MKNLLAAVLTFSAFATPAIAENKIAESAPSFPNAIARVLLSESVSPQSSNNFKERTLKIAKQIPTDTMGMVMVDLDPKSWQAIAGMSQINPIGVIAQLIELFGGDLPISFAKDIQPWLAQELTLVFLNESSEVSAVAIAPLADSPKFDQFLAKVQTIGLPKPTETLYQSVKILEWQLPDPEPEQADLGENQNDVPEADAPMPIRELGFIPKKFAIAKLPNGLALIATSRQGIEQLIDTPETNSLADNPLFLRSLKNPLWSKSVLAAYGDFKELGKIAEFVAQDIPESSPIPGFNRAEYIQGLKYTLSQYSSFDLFTWATPNGIRSQSNSYFSEVRPPQPKDTEPRDRLLAYLPENVYGVISSRNLNRQWQWFVEESKVQPSYKVFVEGLKLATTFIIGGVADLDIEKDIISWIDGEYALVAFPSATSPFAQDGGDFAMGVLIRTSKPEAANLGLEKIAKFLSQQDLQIKKRQVGATTLTSFEFADPQVSGKTQSVFAYGWRDRQTLLLTLGSATANEFIPSPKVSFGRSTMFREIIADLPQPNFGYFYLNAKAIAVKGAQFYLSEFMSSDLPESSGSELKAESENALPPEIQSVINKLGGLVFVYSETSDRFQADFAIDIK
ncbi:MAG: hypothetical protein AUK48_04570 [Oscillatoriales cyanobacterium CG2_30_44_21]|nr:MAG: hypothetical protein AUK48_04570 [Oscillatoriales cyanobacterium CG2_30_44_21]